MTSYCPNDPGCSTCYSSTACSVCKASFYLKSGETKCTFCSDLNCSTCKETSNNNNNNNNILLGGKETCTVCKTGYYISSTGTCVSNQNCPNYSNCSVCNASSCTTCSTGYYLRSSTCYKCSDFNCTSCSYNSYTLVQSCLTCIADYYPDTISSITYYKCEKTTNCPFDDNCVLCTSNANKGGNYIINNIYSMCILQNRILRFEWKMYANLYSFKLWIV